MRNRSAKWLTFAIPVNELPQGLGVCAEPVLNSCVSHKVVKVKPVVIALGGKVWQCARWVYVMRAPVSAKGIYILTTGPYGVTTGLIAQHKSATVRSQLSHDRRRPSFTASRCSAKGLRLALHRRLSRECDQTRAGVQHAASVSSNGHAAACEVHTTPVSLNGCAQHCIVCSSCTEFACYAEKSNLSRIAESC